MVDKLLEAKEALIDAKENEADLRNKILALQAAAEESGQLEDENGLLFELDESGNRDTKPFCNLCYVKEQKKIRLILKNEEGFTWYQCLNCKNSFDG